MLMWGTCFRTVENGGSGSPNGGDIKRMRRSSQSKTIKVDISFAAKIPVQAIGNALRGQETENSQEALRVLDIILRQIAAKQYVKYSISFVFFFCSIGYALLCFRAEDVYLSASHFSMIAQGISQI